jgi:subtilisin family serine protease
MTVEQATSKLGADLEILLHARRQTELDRSPLGRLRERMSPESEVMEAAGRDAAKVEVFVEFTDEIAKLEEAGLKVIGVVGNIAVGEVTLDGLDAVAALNSVVRIESSHSVESNLDVSVKEIRAKELHEPPLGLKGKDVIVAVIDDGFDYQHGTFMHADGTSRILLLLDMDLEAKNGEKQFSPHSKGVVYNNDDINAALKEAREGRDPLKVVRHRPQEHGTHVAGIAAGNGSVAGNCAGPNTYVGVAPEADLVLVAALVQDSDTGWATDAELLIATAYILSEAGERPIVITTSLGHHVGPHDGSNLYEAGIDSLLSTPRRAFVVAAGNEGDKGLHASGKVSADASGTDVRFRISANPDRRVYSFELWYVGADRLDFYITPPRGEKSKTFHPLDKAQEVSFGESVDELKLDCNSQIAASRNGDNLIFIVIVGRDQQDPFEKTLSSALPSGIWTLTLIPSEPTRPINGEFHCWVRQQKTKTLGFLPPFRDDNYTVNTPGTSKSAIAVGSYQTGVVAALNGRLSASSSRGPTRDGRPKPEITAPGQRINSAKSEPGRLECCACCQDQYTIDTGTSMAAPHVAGVIALMFQKDRTLTQEEIRKHLFDTARKDSFTGPLTTANNEWGHGKLNAIGAVNSVDGPDPSSGPAVVPPPLVAIPNQPMAGTEALTRKWLDVQREILDTQAGQRLGALIVRHFSTVRALIETNKRVATVWHRNDGPLLLRHVLEAAQWPNRPLPIVVNGRPAIELVSNILSILKRYGSPSLADDICEWTPKILELSGLSLNQLLQNLRATE